MAHFLYRLPRRVENRVGRQAAGDVRVISSYYCHTLSEDEGGLTRVLVVDVVVYHKLLEGRGLEYTFSLSLT